MLKDIIQNNDKFVIITDSKETNLVAKKALEIILIKMGKLIEQDSFKIGINSNQDNIFNLKDKYSISKLIAKFAFDNHIKIDQEEANLLMRGILIDTNATLYKVADNSGMKVFDKLQKITKPHEIYKETSGRSLKDLETIIYIYKNVKNLNGVNTIQVPKQFISNIENNITFFVDEIFGIMRPDKVEIILEEKTLTFENSDLKGNYDEHLIK